MGGYPSHNTESEWWDVDTTDLGGNMGDVAGGFPRRRGWSSATRLRTLPRNIWGDQRGKIAPSDSGGIQ
jgi:hypothetical protein